MVWMFLFLVFPFAHPSSQEARKKAALVATLHAAFRPFESKTKSGHMDASDLVRPFAMNLGGFLCVD